MAISGEMAYSLSKSYADKNLSGGASQPGKEIELLNTLEDVEKCTEYGKSVDAMAIKELIEKIENFDGTGLGVISSSFEKHALKIPLSTEKREEFRAIDIGTKPTAVKGHPERMPFVIDEREEFMPMEIEITPASVESTSQHEEAEEI